MTKENSKKLSGAKLDSLCKKIDKPENDFFDYRIRYEEDQEIIGVFEGDICLYESGSLSDVAEYVNEFLSDTE